MEINIDTSILSNSLIKSNNTVKLEESVTSDLEKFVNESLNNNKANNYTENNIKENLVIKIHTFLIENPDDKNLVIYGCVIQNNQNLYEISENDNVFIFIKDPHLITNFISNFVKSRSKNYLTDFTERFDIESSIVIKYDDRVDNEHKKNKIYLILLFMSSIIKIFFSFTKFKYSKWDNILLQNKCYEESFLISRVLNLIGYKFTVDVAKFENNKNYTKEDFIFSDREKERERVSYSPFIDTNEETDQCLNAFKYIIRTTEELLNNKIKIFSFLTFEGIYIMIGSNSLCNSQKSAQLDPRDLEVANAKNISINFTNIETCVKFNQTAGRQINFIVDIIRKLTCTIAVSNVSNKSNLQSQENNLLSNFRQFFKKLDPKLFELNETLKDITIADFSSNKNFISIFLFKSLENN